MHQNVNQKHKELKTMQLLHNSAHTSLVSYNQTHRSTRLAVDRDMLWCQSAQNIVLSNHKLKSALKCTV